MNAARPSPDPRTTGAPIAQATQPQRAHAVAHRPRPGQAALHPMVQVKLRVGSVDGPSNLRRRALSIVGSVDRRQIAPAVGGQPEQENPRRDQVNNIRFDPDCNLVVPYRIQFRQRPTAQSATSCLSPPPATAVPALSTAQVKSISDRYIAAMNEGLSGWYSVMVEGCDQACAGKPIPIRVMVSEVTTNPDRTVDIVPRGGRGDAAPSAPTLSYPASPSTSTATRPWEPPTSIRKQRPRCWPPSPNGVGASAFATTVVHERSGRLRPFRAVPRATFPVRAGLHGSGRLRPGLRGQPEVGEAGPDRLPVRYRIGWRVAVRGSQLPSVQPVRGDRHSVEAQTSPETWGFTSKLFGSTGVLYRPESKPYGEPTIPSRTPGYGEGGLGLGLHTDFMSSSVDLHIRAEAELGAEMAQDEDAMPWFRPGVALERQRRFMFELGAHGQAPLLSGYKERNAFMAGARRQLLMRRAR